MESSCQKITKRRGLYSARVIGIIVCPKEPVPPVPRMDELLSMSVRSLAFLRYSGCLTHDVFVCPATLNTSPTQFKDLCAVLERGEAVCDDQNSEVPT